MTAIGAGGSPSLHEAFDFPAFSARSTGLKTAKLRRLDYNRIESEQRTCSLSENRFRERMILDLYNSSQKLLVLFRAANSTHRYVMPQGRK